MKKLIALTVLLISGVLITSQASAQDGTIKVGGGLMYGSGVFEGGGDINNHLGLRVNGYYTINEDFRAGADIGYFFPDEQGDFKVSVWEFNLNGNYMFYKDDSQGLSAYGLAGLNFLSIKTEYNTTSQYGSFSGSGSDTKTGLNLGVGGEYNVNFGVIYAELKYVLSDADELVLGAGVRLPI